MIGTTRSRVSFFLNRFRDLGFINYDGEGMHIHSSWLASCSTIRPDSRKASHQTACKNWARWNNERSVAVSSTSRWSIEYL